MKLSSLGPSKHSYRHDLNLNADISINVYHLRILTCRTRVMTPGEMHIQLMYFLYSKIFSRDNYGTIENLLLYGGNIDVCIATKDG